MKRKAGLCRSGYALGRCSERRLTVLFKKKYSSPPEESRVNVSNTHSSLSRLSAHPQTIRIKSIIRIRGFLSS